LIQFMFLILNSICAICSKMVSHDKFIL
jgi:hypothetical protein